VPADACTRVLYVAKDGTVIVGRSMYWDGDMMPIMWVLSRALVSVRGLD
jgi:penicillin V acylase-like amidase (Ntn superfamily)